MISVNNILFKYKVHRYTTDTSYIQYNTFEKDTEISVRLGLNLLDTCNSEMCKLVL